MPATQFPVDSRAVRERLVEALRLDLVGPWASHELGAEQLSARERPSNWYVAGFPIPTAPPPERSAADEDDDRNAALESAGLTEESNDEPKAARNAFFPSSTGLSLIVAAGCRELAVTARWANHPPVEIEEASAAKTPVWRRMVHEEALSVPLGGDAGPAVREVPSSGGLQLHVIERPTYGMRTDGSELPAGTASASCFLVNRRTPGEAQPDCPYAFQAEIEVRSDEGFVPRPDLRAARPEEWDDQVADLHYPNTPKHTTRLAVSAHSDVHDRGCRALRTASVGAAEVEKTAASDVPGVEPSMEVLGPLHGQVWGHALDLVERCRCWTDEQRRRVETGSLHGAWRQTAELDYAMVAADRTGRARRGRRSAGCLPDRDPGDGTGPPPAARRSERTRRPALAARSSSRSRCSPCPALQIRTTLTASPSTCGSSRPAATRPKRTCDRTRRRWCCGAYAISPQTPATGRPPGSAARTKPCCRFCSTQCCAGSAAHSWLRAHAATPGLLTYAVPCQSTGSLRGHATNGPL